MGNEPSSRFEKLAAGKQPGFLAQFIDFARHNKKWWLAPLLVLLLLASLLVILGGTGLAPFIYTVF